MCDHIYAAISKHGCMRWAGPQERDRYSDRERDGTGRVLFITCPRVFTRGPMDFDPKITKLRDWAKAGFPDGRILYGEILWVVAPDPGCELIE